MRTAVLLLLATLLLAPLGLAQILPPSHLSAEVDRASGEVQLQWLGYDQEELAYDDGTVEAGYTPNSSNPSGYAYLLRMSAAGPAELQAVSAVLFEGFEGPDNHVELNDVQFLVFGEGPSDSQPGDLLYTSPTISPENSGWLVEDLTAQGLNVAGDFWVGVAFDAPYGPVMGFDENNSSSGRLYTAVPPYENFTASGIPECPVIHALLRYEDPSLVGGVQGDYANRNTLDTAEVAILASTRFEYPQALTLQPAPFGGFPAMQGELDEFVEYHLYRNGDYVGSTGENSYTDALNQLGNAVYTVTAQFDEGESESSNAASVYWTAGAMPPQYVTPNVDLETGEVELSWQAPVWSGSETVLQDHGEEVDGVWNWNGATFGMRFEPDQLCQLMAVRYHLVATSEFGVQIYDFNGSWPDDVMYETTTSGHVPGWVEINLEDQYLFFDQPFLVGWHDLNQLSAIFWNEATDAPSYLRNPNGDWSNFNGELALHIQAVVQYPDGSRVAIHPGGAGNELDELTGFEIYRNGALVGSAGADDRSYSDALPDYGSYEYLVRAQYDEGTPPASDPVTAFWQQNLIANGSFEEWSGGQPTGWNVDIGNNAQVFQDQSVVQQGASSMRIEYTSEFSKKLKQQVPAEEGQEFTFGAWLLDDDPQGIAYIMMLFRDEQGEGAAGEQEGVDQFTGSPIPDSPDWQYVQVSGVAPENTHDVRIYVRFQGSDDWAGEATAWADNAALFGPYTEIEYHNIEAIQTELAPGTTLRTSGIVTMPTNTIDTADTRFYIQDATGYGVQVYQDGAWSGEDLVRGDEVEVTAFLTEVEGVTQLEAQTITLLSTGNEVPDPVVATTGDLTGMAGMEGTWVRTTGLRGPIFDDEFGYYMPLDDGSGWISVRLFEDTGITLEDTDENDQLRIQGVLWIQYDSVLLVPALDSDIERLAAVEDGNGLLPDRFAIAAVAPNPFNPVTTLTLHIPHRSEVVLSAFNLLGQRVAQPWRLNLPPGVHRVPFDGSNLGSGLYFLQMSVDGQHMHGARLMLMK